jgi:hypothetical protein
MHALLFFSISYLNANPEQSNVGALPPAPP